MSAVAHKEIHGNIRPRDRRGPGVLGRFLPSSVRWLVIVGFGLLIVLLACITLGAAWQVRQHQADLTELEYHSNEASLLQNAEAQAGIAALLLQRYVAAGTDTDVAEINEHADKAQASLVAALAAGGPAGLDGVVSSGSTLVLEAARSAQLREQGNLTEASAVLEEIVPIFKDYRLKLEALAAQEIEQADDLRSRANDAGDLAFWLIVSSGVVGIALALAASFWIARSIIKPLGALEKTARLVSAGDLAARAPVDGPREFSHLGLVLNEMMSAIEERTADLRTANEELSEKNRDLNAARTEAATDPLTGLGNHRSFHSRLRAEVASAQASGSSLGLIIIDLDGFKDVNDSLGHLAGDQLLRDLAGSLYEVTRGAYTYRYGGDELAVLLPGADCSQAMDVADRLKQAVSRVTTPDGKQLTASLGVACYPDSAPTAEELVYRADMAMYWAKSTGKNRVTAWESSLTQDLTAVRSRYFNGRKEPVTDVVAAFCAALAAKDPDTGEHTERCSWYTAELAGELGLSEEDITTARIASLLHDIGKLTVPDEILRKPGPLTDDETERMHRHSRDGANMLTQVESLAPSVPGILHHHEHFDGSGYPDGLAGQEIPIVARILLVSDAFDTMTTGRPYSAPIPHDEAIAELRRRSGSQFDPEVVEAFVRVIARTGGFPSRRATERAASTPQA